MRTGLSVEGMGQSKAMSRSQGRVIVGPGLSRMAEVFTEHAGLLPTGSHLHSRKESSPARTRKEVQTQVPHPQGSLFSNTFFSPPLKPWGSSEHREPFRDAKSQGKVLLCTCSS